MEIALRTWLLILGFAYAVCVGIAFSCARPNATDVMNIILLISALAVCVLSPTIEWFLRDLGSAFSPTEDLNRMMKECDFFRATLYYTAYLLCCYTWKYVWLGVIGGVLTVVLVFRLWRQGMREC